MCTFSSQMVHTYLEPKILYRSWFYSSPSWILNWDEWLSTHNTARCLWGTAHYKGAAPQSLSRLSSLSFDSLWTEPSPAKLATASLFNSDPPLLPLSGFTVWFKQLSVPWEACLPARHSCAPAPPASCPALSPSRGSPQSAPVCLWPSGSHGNWRGTFYF